MHDLSSLQQEKYLLLHDDKMDSCSTNVLLGFFRLVLVLTVLHPSLAGMYRFSLVYNPPRCNALSVHFLLKSSGNRQKAVQVFIYLLD